MEKELEPAAGESREFNVDRDGGQIGSFTGKACNMHQLHEAAVRDLRAWRYSPSLYTYRREKG